MMATAQDQLVYPVFSPSGIEPPLFYKPEAAAQSFKAGEFVFLDTNGRVTVIASDTPAQIYGVAATDASGVTDADVAIYLAERGVWFEINMKQTGLANHVLAITDMATVMAIQRDTANHKVFLNATLVGGAGGRMFVHGISPRMIPSFTFGDTNVRVVASFISSALMY
jgi:hypothetical protein